jgi:signal peptidase
LLIDVVALALMTHVASAAGIELYIIRGTSMEPALPLGSLVATESVDPRDLHVGDIVTIQKAHGVIVTHRIVGFQEPDQGPRLLRTRGDASGADDLILVPDTAVVGRATWYVPALGFVLAYLSTPTGMIGVLSFIGTLLVAIWFVEEFLRVSRRIARPAVSLFLEARG